MPHIAALNRLVVRGKTLCASAVLGAVLMLALSAGSAYAANEVFMRDRDLSAGNAYGTVSSTMGVVQVDGYAFNTHCPAVEQGFTGYTSTPNSGGNFLAHEPTCGPYSQVWNPAGTSGITFHGAEYNPNSTTRDSFTSAEYWW